MTNKFLISGLIALSVAGAGSVAVAQSRVNRVRPPQNTEQYAQEAARVRMRAIAEAAGLTEEQFALLAKTTESRRKAIMKSEEKLAEEKQRWEKACAAAAEAAQKADSDYDADLRKLMSADQYEAYRQWLRTTDGIEDCDDAAQPEAAADSISPAGLDGIVPAPKPTILTE